MKQISRLVKTECGAEGMIPVSKTIEIDKNVLDQIKREVEGKHFEYKALINRSDLYNIQTSDIETIPAGVKIEHKPRIMEKIKSGSAYLEVMPKGYEITQVAFAYLSGLASKIKAPISYIKLDSTNGRYIPRGYLIKPPVSEEEYPSVFSKNVSLINIKQK